MRFSRGILIFLFFLPIFPIYATSIFSLVTEETKDYEATESKVNHQYLLKEFYLHPKLEPLQDDSLFDLNAILDVDLALLENKNEINKELVLLLDKVVKFLRESRNYEAYLELNQFSEIQIKKNALFEFYYFLLAYLSFSYGFYQDSYLYSRNYLENFYDYQGVYSALYFYLYSALITNKNFIFLPLLKEKNFLNHLPTFLKKPMSRLIIEYALVTGNYDLGIQYLKKEKNKKLLLDLIMNTYDIVLLEKYSNAFLEKKVQEEIFFRKNELLYFNRQIKTLKLNLNEFFLEEDNYSKSIRNKFTNLQKKIEKIREPIKIGILAPFSTRHPIIIDIVKQMQASINIFYVDNAEYYEFYFLDTALEPELTKKNYKKLVDEGVIAVIGPIARINTQAILEQSNEAEVPILALTRRENIGADYPFVYRYQRNKEKENQNLVNYSLDYLNSENIIAFYDSKNSYNDVLLFQEKLKKRNKKLALVEKIDFKNDSIIQNTLRKMTGVYRYLNRYEEKIYNPLQEEIFVPFPIDAIYLPFQLDKIQHLNSFLPSYNLQDVNLLANANINDALNKDHNLKKLYFADQFFFDKNKPLAKKYKNYYSLTSGNKNTPGIYGVNVYELLNLIDELVRRFDIQTADKLKHYLDRINRFSFLETPLRINKKGELSKDYNIYRLSSRGSVPIF